MLNIYLHKCHISFLKMFVDCKTLVSGLLLLKITNKWSWGKQEIYSLVSCLFAFTCAIFFVVTCLNPTRVPVFKFTLLCIGGFYIAVIIITDAMLLAILQIISLFESTHQHFYFYLPVKYIGILRPIETLNI